MMPDLAMHILDLIQNSIEAGASKITLSILENTKQDILKISIEDNGKGMNEDLLKSVKDPFTTTRTVRKVGLGIPLLEMSTSLCGGDLTLESEVGKGTKVKAIFQYNHIDRPPLGDIKNTILSIVVANQLLDFKYIHEVNNNKFVFSTIEIRDILDGVSLLNPEVLKWLQEYIKMNIENLYGGVN